jgi:(p)ppGpp synthase/HD superfamily hydrolase
MASWGQAFSDDADLGTDDRMNRPVPIPALEDAIALAAHPHWGQIYPSPNDEPFILHPLRVMLAVDGTIDHIVAVLHDLVEDTDWSLQDLQDHGYPQCVIEALDHLTRRSGEQYEAYIDRVARNALARRVKLADLADNLTNNRHLPRSTTNRERISRYEWARARLLD